MVERYQIGQVQARALPSAPQPRASAAAFGAEQGQTLQRLGHGMVAMAGQVDQTDSLIAEARAKDAYSAFGNAALQLVGDFGVKKGRDAIDGVEEATVGLTDLARQFEDGLDDQAKRMYRRATTSRLGMFGQSIRDHHQREALTYANQADEANNLTLAQDLVASWDRPSERDVKWMAIQNNIQAMGARNGWAPEVTEAKLRDAETGVYGDLTRQMLAKGDVAGAQTFYRENADRFHGDAAAKMELTLTAYRRDAEAQQERAEAKARAERAKITDREVNTAFVRIGRGEENGYGIIQDLVDRNVIAHGDDHWRTLTLRADAAQKEYVEREGLISLAHDVGAGRVVADPNDPKLRHGADLAIQRMWPELPPNPYERNAELARMTGNYRFIPNVVAGQVRALQGGSPEQQVIAADLFAQLQEVNPTAVETTFGKHDAYRAELLTTYVRGGLSPEDAVKKADQDLSPANLQYVENREKRLKEEIKEAKGQPKILPKDVVGWFDPGLLSFEPGASADVVGVMADQANEAYRRAFLSGLDEPGAKAAAQREIKAQWGVTELNGGKTIMRYPPEALFGPGSSDWMKRQLGHDVAARFEQMKAPGETLSRVQIVADPGRTSRGFSTGRPEYVVIAQTGSGELRPLGYWTPDLAAQRALDAAVAARDTAAEVATAEARQARVDARYEQARSELAAAEKSGNPLAINAARAQWNRLNPAKPTTADGPAYGSYAEGND